MRSYVEILDDALKLHLNGDLDGAAFVYDHLLAQAKNPEPNLLYRYGTLLVATKRYGLGLALLRTASQGLRNFAPIWTNIGMAHKAAGDDAAAFDAFTKSLKIDPEAPDTLSNVAGWYLSRGTPKEAEGYARKALAKDPTKPQARLHLAFALLEQGRFEEAWPYYEARWDVPDGIPNRRHFKAPRWTGEHVGTLAVHGEQGLGDEIMFMGCFPLLAGRADRIVVEAAPRLCRMFREAFDVPCYPDEPALVAAVGEPDAYIPMGSLPSIVGMPTGKPYLGEYCPNPGVGEHLRVGIAWAGGVQRTNKVDRTLTLDDFEPLFALRSLRGVDLDFVSVQYDRPGAAEDAALHHWGVMDRMNVQAIQDRIEECDLIISALQTAVHQAGAAGVPCWALTPRKCNWVFAGHGETMPWYRSVKLYRQDKSETWAPVIARAASDLRNLCAKVAA